MGRCSECPGVNNCLEPYGPPGGPLFIGEAPGAEENKRKCVFVGKTGKEVDDHYLPLAGLQRHKSRIINAIACLPNTPKGKLDPNNKKHQELLRVCADHHLYPEMNDNTPTVLVPMGAFACQAIDLSISLDIHHGIPRETSWGIPAFPMYHPALGMHSPKRMLDIRTDWIRFKKYLAGKLHVPVDEYPRPDYAEIRSVAELRAYLDPTLPLAADTESSPVLGPYFFSFTHHPGEGRLIRCDNPQLVSALAAILSTWEGDIWFHNWLYDAGVLSALGLLTPALLRRVRDSMAWAYHLGNLPQGLKALAYRLLGMEMQDFEDLVIPHSIPRVLDYYKRAQAISWPKPFPEMVRDDEGNLKEYKPQGMNTKLKRFFTDYGKNPDKDVFNMWTKNWQAEQEMIETELGPWPGKDIAHVPFEQSLFYACRDVDALIRLIPILQRMRERVPKFPQEEWAA